LISDQSAANLDSPDQYYSALVNAGKAVFKAESEALGLEGQAPVVRASENPIDGAIDTSLTRITDVKSTVVVSQTTDSTDAFTQAAIEMQILLLPMMKFKGVFGAWYKMRGAPSAEDKGYYNVQAIKF